MIGRSRRRKSFRNFKFNSSDDESVLQTEVDRISSSISVSKKGNKTRKPIPAPRVTGRKDGGALASERASPALDVGARTSSVGSGLVGSAVGVSRGSPAHASASEREETAVRAPPASYALALRAGSSLPMPMQVSGESETMRAMDARASTDEWGETSMPLPQSKQAAVACGVSPSLTLARKVNAPVTLGGSCARVSPAGAASTGTGSGTHATQVSRGSTIGINWCDIMDGDARCGSTVVDGGASGARAGASTPAVATDVAASTSSASVFTKVELLGVPDMPRVPRGGSARLVLKRKSRGGKQLRAANPSTSTPSSDDGDSGSEGRKRRRITTVPAPTPAVTEPAGAPALAKGGSVVAPPSADPCVLPLDTLRRRASELTREMTAFCLDDTKKINKWQMAVITAKFGEMGSIVGDLLLRNARLEGRVVELTKRAPVATSDGLAGGRVIESKQSFADKLKTSSDRTGAGRAPPPVTNVTARAGPVPEKSAAASHASAAGAPTARQFRAHQRKLRGRHRTMASSRSPERRRKASTGGRGGPLLGLVLASLTVVTGGPLRRVNGDTEGLHVRRTAQHVHPCTQC